MRPAMIGVFVLLCATLSAAANDEAGVVTVTVTGKMLSPVDERLFGQFMARPSWGENGAEGAYDPASRSIRPDVAALIEKMHIPLLRFPGGTDVDFVDWTDMIDGVHGRNGGRPLSTGHSGNKVTNRFGLDEYLRFRAQLGAQTIVAVNLLDGLARRKPLRKAALYAAGLVAYANAPAGAHLPKDMPDWPALRAANGHRDPYGVEYIQLGNEWSQETFLGPVMRAVGHATREQLAAWYIECLHEYIDAIRAVDSHVELIIDSSMGNDIDTLVAADPQIRQEVKWQAIHAYAPGRMNRVRRNSEEYRRPLTEEEFWYAATTMPGGIGPDGESIWANEGIERARVLGYKVACTEWNWNGWFSPSGAEPEDEPRHGIAPLGERFLRAFTGGGDAGGPAARVGGKEAPLRHTATALGAAGFIHALMREGDTVRLATQSMLVGHQAGIAAVHYDLTGSDPAYYLPQGTATTFYNLHHGNERLETSWDGVKRVNQPFSIGRGAASTPAVLDIVATRGNGRLFLHVINRDYARDHKIAVTLDGLKRGSGQGMLYVLEGRDGEPASVTDAERYVTTSSRGVPEGSETAGFIVAKRSVAILEIPLGQ